MKDYIGYAWIEVPRYKMDPNKSWEERYKDLERHHVEETNFLINEVRKLAARLAGGPDLDKQVADDEDEDRLPAECWY